MTITLGELRTQSRQRADAEDSNFIKDSELNSYINSSIAELHDILVQSYSSDYFIDLSEFNTVQDQADYPLPADFYKVRGVDAMLNGADWFTISTFNFNERNRFEKFGVWSLLGIGNVRYRLVGSNLRFNPVPDKTTPIRLWYIPVAETLVADGDVLNNVNGYEEYVIVDAAIKMLQKEESDVSILLVQKAALIKRIEHASQNRDAGESESVTDIYAANDDYYWRTRG